MFLERVRFATGEILCDATAAVAVDAVIGTGGGGGGGGGATDMIAAATAAAAAVFGTI